MKKTVDLNKLIQKINRVLDPIIPASDSTLARQDFLHAAERSKAGRELASYYLVYFLLVDLLKFENLGQFEKVAWSIPIDYRGKAYLIEYRKMGVGVFVQDKLLDEPAAVEITKKINRAIRIAEPYFDELAENAITHSKVNLTNKHRPFFNKYLYFLSLYEKHCSNLNKQSHEQIQESIWLAIATIESFFSWSEHIFIHLALLTGRITSGPQAINLISDDWDKKFKAALDISNAEINKWFNELTLIKKEIRNFVAHGGAGKNGDCLLYTSPSPRD